MASTKRTVSLAALAMLAFVCHAAIGVNSDQSAATAYAIKVSANGNDTASIPDFDGDGTIGFGDFVKFAAKFGLSQGDVGYDAQFDLNDDGEIGFADFLIFAENFGKDAPSPAVTIPDANLRAAIEAALGKDSNAPFTEAEMATLDSLDANDADVSVLTGLEFAVNLTHLSLNDNNITNISALAKLTTLTQLWLSNNSIEDISALSGLTNLKTLILTGNDISDLAPLAANTGLGAGSTVDVTDNPLNPASHSTHIPALQARGVSVSFVPSPVVRIPDANLRAAIEAALGKASGAPITQAEMATLTRIDAPNEGIRSLTGLEHAINLTRLELGGAWADGEWVNSNDISDLAPLSNLTNLTWLFLSNNSISDISALSNLTNMTTMGLDVNSISDISALANLANLESLSLNNNSNSDISALSNLTNLESLSLDDNSISDISALSNLTNLVDLSLWYNSISDISALANLTNLTWLYLNWNSISDISALTNLTNLQLLGLGDNSISDISPLVSNTGLGSGDTVDLTDNPLSSTSRNTHIPTLQRRGVTVEFRQ